MQHCRGKGVVVSGYMICILLALADVKKGREDVNQIKNIK